MICACGCGEQTRIATKTCTTSNRIKGQPMRYVHGHNARRTPEDYVVVAGCWVWQRSANRAGYPMVFREGKSRSAHRWYYEQRVGVIPEGLDLDHLCRNKLCVNPDHLEPVTHKENVQRGWRSRGGTRRPWADGTHGVYAQGVE